ncbi:MAG: hypothetical protein KDD98_04940, partial [Sphingomonadaceae bacterium]|nr:hypothetical protein [Sphingomonadaceae bacterium]
WCQEEPRNQGSWFFVDRQIEMAAEKAGKAGLRPTYAGRDAAASPATGLASRHIKQQEALVEMALGLSDGGKTLKTTSRTARPRKTSSSK